MPIKSKIRGISAFIAILIVLTAMCSCSEKAVEVWRLVKEYDIEGLDFKDFENIAEDIDKKKYFAKVDHETEHCDAFMTVMPIGKEYWRVANINKYSSIADAKKYYENEMEVIGTLNASAAIVRINDMLITGDGFTVKMLLENIGIATHNPVTVPAGSKLKRIDDLANFEKAEKVLSENGYTIYSDEQIIYTIYSPDGTECYKILRFSSSETDERAYEAAKLLYDEPDSDWMSGVNVYYCDTYAVCCVGDQWIQLTEGILK